MPPLPDFQQSAIDQALFKGHKIEAIKLYRSSAGCDLKDAKDAVEQRESELRIQDPSRFTRQSSGCMGLLLLGPLALLALWLAC